MEKEYETWLGRKKAEKCVENLKKRQFDAHFVETRQEAATLALQMAENRSTFGFGGSETTRDLGLVEALEQKGKTVYDHWRANLSKEEEMDIRLNQGRCDMFFCGANAISMTGEIVNVDGIGNRTSAMAFGPEKVVIIAGVNKLTIDLDSALKRIREVAGPIRAKSLNMATPCAETGFCSDCKSPQRICRITSILHFKPMLTDVSVILVNASMGF